MKKKLNRKGLAVAALAALLPLAAILAIPGTAFSDDTPAASASQEEKAAEAPARLDGAKVYAWNCGSCHSERYPSERNDADWELIATHMRVRANLTAAQTAAVLDYLQENNR